VNGIKTHTPLARGEFFIGITYFIRVQGFTFPSTKNQALKTQKKDCLRLSLLTRKGNQTLRVVSFLLGIFIE